MITKLKIDYTGKKIGNWTIIKKSDKFVRNRQEKAWLCQCNCGKFEYKRGHYIDNMTKKSCCIECKNKLESQNAIHQYFESVKVSAQQRKHSYNLDKDEALKLLTQQNFKCALSGITIHFAKTTTKRAINQTASIDRIDSSLGYDISNIQWVHKDINRMKRKLSDQKFIDLCTDVVKYNTEKLLNYA